MQIRLPKEASSETGPTCQQTMTSSSNVGSTSICRGLATRLLLQIIWQFQKTCSDAFTPISSLTSHQLSPLLYACVGLQPKEGNWYACCRSYIDLLTLLTDSHLAVLLLPSLQSIIYSCSVPALFFDHSDAQLKHGVPSPAFQACPFSKFWYSFSHNYSTAFNL